MVERLYPNDDFEATIRIYSKADGGRSTPAFNGIRWDFAYAEDQLPNSLYMIWPDFYATDGMSLPTDQGLPIGVPLHARMLILMDEMRSEVHRARLAPGTRFYCHEGARRVAEGVVTRITGLFESREN
jgi:translation elongation factor EF-Tu-like GTPase